MELLGIVLGVVIGAVAAYIIFNLRNKNVNVSKAEFEAINTKYNEINTKLIVAEERGSSIQQEYSRADEKLQNALKELNELKQLNAEYTANIKSLTESNNTQADLLEKQKNRETELSEKITQLTSENSTLSANNKSLQEKLLTQKDEIIEIQKTAHLQFEKIANQILEDKSGKFTEVNKANMEAVLKPLAENIDTFKKKSRRNIRQGI
jgi:DNA recombination protein RmuC